MRLIRMHVTYNGLDAGQTDTVDETLPVWAVALGAGFASFVKEVPDDVPPPAAAETPAAEPTAPVPDAAPVEEVEPSTERSSPPAWPE